MMGIDLANENIVDPEPEHLWPMGAVTRRTGISEHTLRAWERRFGFPIPHRLPSGHRRYTADQVQQLLLIREALQAGYRAGDVVSLPLSELEELLRECGREEVLVREPSPAWLQRIIEAGKQFDRDELAAQLRVESANLGVARFLRERVAPILAEVGDAWERGDLEIRHEHFISEAIEDELRGLRGSLEASAAGRPVVLANLPDEFHELGLQIAAVAIVAAGRSIRMLGRNTPVQETVEAAVALDAAAVGLSVSKFAVSDATAAAVIELRSRLPARIRLWLGGGGADDLENLPVDVEVVSSLDELERVVRSLRA
jgi:DNA-binding transcriptional MerR regulator